MKNTNMLLRQIKKKQRDKELKSKSYKSINSLHCIIPLKNIQITAITSTVLL